MGCGSSSTTSVAANLTNSELPELEDLEEKPILIVPIAQEISERNMGFTSTGSSSRRKQSFVRIMSERRLSETSAMQDSSSSIERRATEPKHTKDEKVRKERTGGSARDVGDPQPKLSKPSFIRRLSQRASVGKLFGSFGAENETRHLPLSPLMALIQMKDCTGCWLKVLRLLSITELCLFDSAVTNKSLRSDLLEALARMHVLEVPYTIFATNTLARWLSQRDLFIGGAVRLHPLESDDTCILVGDRCDPSTVHTVSLRRSGARVGALSGKGILRILRPCPRATTVDLTDCRNMTDFDMEEMLSGCCRVEHLTVKGCVLLTDVSVLRICTIGRDIVTLNLGFCRQVTDNSLHSIANAKLKNLVNLSLLECRKITNSGVAAVSRGCPGLQALNLSWCGKLTDDCLTDLAGSCNSLQALSLVGLRHITDEGVGVVLEANPHLLALDLRRCGGITDDTMASLSSCSPKLQQLYLSECRALSDESVAALAYGCVELTTLFVNECALITDMGLEALSYGCANLKILDISFCPNVHPHTVQSVMAQNPSLTMYYSCYQRPPGPSDFILF